MSETKTDAERDRLIRAAEHTNDPAKLYAIGDKLTHQGAWNAAAHVYHKAREFERLFAERVQK